VKEPVIVANRHPARELPARVVTLHYYYYDHYYLRWYLVPRGLEIVAVSSQGASRMVLVNIL
jgi:hypothetical protein